ncbi:alpha-L-fucosidase [Coraliomargarita algicola]|uniref:alpha-L-fucosidase n=1 Tax=Coraliomargarita algicola TaxID=3092156 RepID=A0ABZ0RNE0_9BACT|nr:alpha-L-fucosidase [Coraliomargarita sp. J2-16]WPJ96931.1 alpha-L-fucosidase [Coraliomargarita sp. J2-16]
MTSAPLETEPQTEYAQRLRWFHQARFGMFIHFGLYSLLERGEWVMFRERIPPEDYAPLADQFNPANWDAEKLAQTAVDAGMRYAVFTARHHDGYCLYDSAVTDFTSTKTAAQRDFVAEFVTAFRKAGLKVGIYYSLLDWRFPGYFEPQKYPESAAALVQQTHDQVRELLSNYGKIDMLWYDGGWISHGRRKEIPEAEFWRSVELNAMARELQPEIIINNRAGTQEDLDTPEQHVTASEAGRGWESCMTICHPAGWGYVRHTTDFKSVSELLQNLVKAAAGEGNFLLNVGPQPDGSLRSEETTRLQAMGDWLQRYGEGIYGSQRCDLPNDSLPGGGAGHWTRQGNTAYLFTSRWPGQELVVPLVGTKAKSATVLGTDLQLGIRYECNHRLVLTGLPEQPPHPDVSVIQIEFEDIPSTLLEDDTSAWLKRNA